MDTALGADFNSGSAFDREHLLSAVSLTFFSRAARADRPIGDSVSSVALQRLGG